MKDRCKDRPLYKAMKKYGIENFSVETLEETEEPEEREKYWIEYFGSFKNGYNATIGGDGKPYIDRDLVVATYNEVLNCREVARRLNISKYSVANILKERNIEMIPSWEVSARKTRKVVNQYSLNDEYIQTFSSIQDAARFLEKENLAKSEKGAANNVSMVCHGKHQTAYGFKWKFVEAV